MRLIISFFILLLLCFSTQANTIYELIKIPNLEIYNLKNENKLRYLNELDNQLYMQAITDNKLKINR